MKNPLISVIVPVYNAEKTLIELCSRLKDSLEKISLFYEIILVEDCGGDASWQIIEQLAASDPRIRGIQFSRNFGQHTGITAGLDSCNGDWAVVMDCDLQDSPEEIPRLYLKALEGYDVVLARRHLRKDPMIKRLSSLIFYKAFSYLADMDYDGKCGNFRIMSRRATTTFCSMRERLRFFGSMVQWMGFPTASIEVLHVKRLVGKSNYTFLKLLILGSDAIIAHSDKPLRIAIKFGFLMALLSFVYGIYFLFHALMYGSPIPGWNSIIISLYFIGGVIISMLGIVGIYLGKTFDESKNRPLYIVRRKTFDEPASTN
jgi:glycosyltransferase involved in cell wall biosynthesis